jgi:leader peptidase (prepilin peptidase) / N-methyltransferase
MVLVITLIGLGIGTLLNFVIARELPGFRRGAQLRRVDGSVGWIPILGSFLCREWVGLAVELVTGLMALTLFLRYGLNPRSLVLFGGSLVLINTAAIDFKIRMIDTLVLVIAMVAALLLAPLNEIGWLRSVLGMALAGIFFFFLYVLARVLFRGVAVPFGLGDIYLGAFIGALVGVMALPTALFYGIALGGGVALVLIVLRTLGRKAPQYIAYGTFLCLGTLLYLATASL